MLVDHVKVLAFILGCRIEKSEQEPINDAALAAVVLSKDPDDAVHLPKIKLVPFTKVKQVIELE